MLQLKEHLQTGQKVPSLEENRGYECFTLNSIETSILRSKPIAGRDQAS